MSAPPAAGSEAITERLISQRWARVLYAGAAIAALVALVVNVTHPWGWQVDATSVGLIGVLLLIPIAEQLRKLKFGALEAEFEERVTRHLGNLERRVKDIGDRASDPLPSSEQAEQEVAVSPPATSRSVRRIIWVDDQPEGNRLEMAELQQRFPVQVARSTDEGIDAVSANPDGTAVISDAVRFENGRQNVDAGKQLISRVQKEQLGVPVYVYCGTDTAQRHGAELYEAGARLVTDSFTELAMRIRSDARRGFYDELKNVLQTAGHLEGDPRGLDYVITLADRRIGVVAKNYRRSATAHTESLRKAEARLESLVKEGKIELGLIITPRDIFLPTQRRQMSESVHLLSIDELPATLLKAHQYRG